MWSETAVGEHILFTGEQNESTFYLVSTWGRVGPQSAEERVSTVTA